MQAEAFSEFYRAVHGYAPFPWQQRLAARVLDSSWPATLAVPTASGKTSVIDIAVFTLAAQAHLPLEERQAPLRLFFVIDRRLVVDEASEHARRLAAALDSAQTGIVAQVAERLKGFNAPRVLTVATLRGGIYREDDWAGAPNQPLVAVTTVDQAGSRLLFRGYGLSPNQYPVQAGLLGNDALFVVDEAHLSRPFIETLQAVARYRNRAELPPPGPFRVMVMSATPDNSEDVFELDEADYSHPVLSQRLQASKPARLEEHPDRRFVKAATDHARSLAREGGIEVVGVIVNRVHTARAVFEALREVGDAVLLTGRIRPHDRDRLLEEWLPRVRTGRLRGGCAPCFLVATQTVEVGANIDLDALVTEAAPLSALRQRFGRLDRLGERGLSHAVILLRQTGHGGDPVYGTLAEETYRWLVETANPGELVVDFGIAPMDALVGQAAEKPPTVPLRNAPVMLPAHVDLWTQTSPIPHPDPEIAPFLRGPELASLDVQLIWRADLGNDEEHWLDIITLQPPGLREVLAVPISAVRAWLQGKQSTTVSDLEGASETDTQPESDATRRVVRWRGEESDLVGIHQIRPGDTLIVPAKWGGADQFGWHPESHEAVTDVADHCAWQMAQQRRRSGRLRLHPALITAWDHSGVLHPALSNVLDTLAIPELADELPTLVEELYSALEGVTPTDHELFSLVERLGGRTTTLQPYPGEGRPTGVVFSTAGPVVITDEDDASSLIHEPVDLSSHLEGVAASAAALARGCGLSDPRQRDIELAGASHDLGKADPRFQVMLYRGDELQAAAGGLLAKSGMNPTDRRGMRQAVERSGLPQGFRHELVSVALLDAEKNLLATADDPELVRYLVAVHHGRARPFAPVVLENRPVSVTVSFRDHTFETSSDHGLAHLSSGWVETFWRLQHRYGPWGLAYLEAVLRLADRSRSREESRA